VGNFSDLYTLDDEVPRLTSRDRRPARFSRVAKYHLPLLWLALFEVRDLRCHARFDEEDRWPYMVSRVDTAVGLLQSRIPALSAIFGPDVGSLANGLGDALIDGAQSSFVILDTQDIGSMVADGTEWTAEMKKMAHAFQEPPPRLVRETSGMLHLAGEHAGPGWKCYLHRFPLEDQAQQRLSEYMAGPDVQA
jgi:hypothetical protein